MNVVANSTTPDIANNDRDDFDAMTSVGRYSDHLSHRSAVRAIGALRERDREPITIRPPTGTRSALPEVRK